MSVVAREFITIESKKDLIAALNTNPSNMLILGGGSNMLLTKNVDALVLHINIKGIKVISLSALSSSTSLTVSFRGYHSTDICVDYELDRLP